MQQNGERLQKVIAQSGITSRRKAEKLIVSGRVKVNGKTVKELGTRVIKSDEVQVNGKPIYKEEHVYYMFNKPAKVISSLDDDKGRKVVTDFFPGVEERIYPIGRLDFHTTGLLLLTNDGEFANLLMHPRYEIEKVYQAKIQGIPSQQELLQLKEGVPSEKELLRAVSYKVLSADRQGKTMNVQLTLQEGKYRHIRRMMEAIGYPVIQLRRIQYGSLTLGLLKPGEYRPLTTDEIKLLRTMARENVKK